MVSVRKDVYHAVKKEMPKTPSSFIIKSGMLSMPNAFDVHFLIDYFPSSWLLIALALLEINLNVFLMYLSV